MADKDVNYYTGCPVPPLNKKDEVGYQYISISPREACSITPYSDFSCLPPTQVTQQGAGTQQTLVERMNK